MRVVTPVPEGRTFTSRPAALLDEVRGLSGLPVELDRGGRGPSLTGNVSRLLELSRPRSGEPSWCFHPSYFVRESRTATWVDAYDDWSIAPDISAPARVLAARGYASVRRSRTPGLVTVNTRYMQLKLGPRTTLLVPNGVDPALAEVTTRGDDRLRVLLMGAFFDGRTDWSLTEAIVNADTVDEVVVVGGHPRIDQLVATARGRGRPVVQVPPMAMPDLAPWIGPRTVFAVPHVVTDYTLSQDLMKVYQAVAMGMRVCVPNALWPSPVSLDLGAVFERGVDAAHVLAAAADDQPDPIDRTAFVAENSWRRRAEVVWAELDHRGVAAR